MTVVAILLFGASFIAVGILVERRDRQVPHRQYARARRALHRAHVRATRNNHRNP